VRSTVSLCFSSAALRGALLKHKETVLRTFTENLMAYGLGRRVTHNDMPTVRGIVRTASGAENRFSAFVLGIVKSHAFQMSRVDAKITTVSPASTPRPRGER
ncbi:MAG TPA: DUF1585 domain-containing protein, partial [Vicinamibacterales bacterium]|nr:DUF1585 domain-containing protein [Vicinamibacterales bacterium]